MEKNNLVSDNFLNLEKYFDNYNNKLSSNFYKRAKEFEFDNKKLFKLAVKYYMFVMQINFYKEEKQRHYRKKFSDIIFKKYNKCIVTNRGINVELEACHIVSVSEGGDYTESNGLLLNRNLHKLYDNYIWSINPDTLIIEAISNNEEIIGSIIDYLGKKVNLIPDFFMGINLKSHWDKFLDKKNKFIKSK